MYNLFPQLALIILTGKSFPESVLLGRLFSVSMTFFAMLFILINYFLSVADFRFIKYLAVFTFLQIAVISTYHNSLVQVQLVLCLSSSVLCLIHLWLVFKKRVVLSLQ
jgi:hypothetical protein